MGVAIVAVPSEDDYVWKISSEKVPHMTMLFLGDVTDQSDLTQIENFLSHMVESTMYRFGMSVDRRGELGPENADVLFFNKDRAIAASRIDMLGNPLIRKWYNSAPQFPGWTPHLTLGYPATPAKKDDRDYGIQWVNFDKIALWVGDYDGPEFQLQDKFESRAEVTMTDHASNILKHHGVKGMKWGVRKDRVSTAIATGKTRAKKEISERTGTDVVVRTNPGAGVRTVGGNKRPAHEDAVKARIAEQVAKKSTLDALSNEDLQRLVNRMNLEQQYRNLANNEDRRSVGEKYVDELLTKNGDKALKKLGPIAPIVQSGLNLARKNSNKALNSGKVKK